MYQYLYDKVPDHFAYLSRIKASAPATADKASLDALIYAHQCNVPFENLDVYELSRPISLGIKDLFQKIVISHRGGYCFEMNGLFLSLLTACGYQAYSCMSRIVRKKDFIAPSMHRANLVLLNGTLHFCDVGYGGPMPAASLPLIDHYEEEIHGTVFCITKFDDYWWTVGRKVHGVYEAILQFHTMPQDPVEFLAPNFYCYANEASYFKTVLLVNKRLPNGSLSITDHLLIKTEDGVKTEHTIASKEELYQILEESFEIKLLEN